jgi:hypothetical protein
MEMKSEEAVRQQSASPGPLPGPKDSAILAADSLLTLFHLFKSEAILAAASLPKLLVLNLALLPLALLAWIGLGVLAACVVYALTASAVWAAAMFFLLQVVVILLVRNRIRQAQARLTFPESRHGLAMMQESWRERMQHYEQKS